MTGKVITIAQQKGGAGKTTLAAQLAVALSVLGHSVATIDIDPQGSLSLWYSARMAELGEQNTLIHLQAQGWRLKKEAERLAQECDFVIIDAPPHADSEASIAVRSANLVLVPMQPSPMDFWACKPVIKLAKTEDVEALLVLNRVAARTKLNEAILDKMDELDITAAKQTLGNRVSFAASMMEGCGVCETEKSGAAAKEISALAREVKKKLQPASKSAKSTKSKNQAVRKKAA